MKKQFRNKNVASDLADRVVEQAKLRGCTLLLGTVVPSTKGANTSLQVLLGYGMSLKSASDNLIIFQKEI